MTMVAGEPEAPWDASKVRSLGVRTDLRTACAVIGIGHTAGYRMAKDGTFPTTVIKVGRAYVVPVAPLLKLLGIEVEAA